MKKSKIILGILILSVIALVFTGCGGGNPVVPPIDNGDGDEEELKFWNGSFANREWKRTTGTDGPEADSNLVYCSDSLDNVWVDDQDRLHLKITYDNANGGWNCAQIVSEETSEGYGYGKYTFYIDNVIMKMANGEESPELDKNVVIGLYTYDRTCSHPSKNEIDLEFSQWGDPSLEEGWFVVWKDASPGQLKRGLYNFPIQLVGKSSVHSFDWTASNIVFYSSEMTFCPLYPESFDYKEGEDIVGPSGEGYGYIPQPQNEKVLMNIWLTGGEPCNDNGIMKSAEIIISSFEFDKDEQTQNHPPTISSLTANPSSVDVNQTTTITCTASDLDGDPLTYHWTKNGGIFEGDTSGPSVTWRAPSTQGNYTITCEVSDGEASDSEQVVINVNVDNDDPSTLPAPATVLASQGTMDMVQIAWSSVTGATHYRVYRATSETGTKTAIEGWGWITNNYTFDFLGITQGVHYFYFVKAATDSIGSNASDYSEYAEGWTTGSYDAIPTIYDPGSSVNSGTPYTVSWSDESADGAEKYNLFEVESTATSGTLYTVYGTSKEFTHNVDKDTTYYYKVRAYSDGAWSSYSDQVDMVVKEAPCEIWTASQSGSGVGVTTDGWDISAVATGSEINFYFDAMGIPDRWFIYYNGVLVYQTGWRGDASYDGDPLYPGGVTSPGDGQVLAVITKLAGVNILEIRTEGKDSNTEWNYSLRSICK